MCRVGTTAREIIAVLKTTDVILDMLDRTRQRNTKLTEDTVLVDGDMYIVQDDPKIKHNLLVVAA